jgi:hypothetical protein
MVIKLTAVGLAKCTVCTVAKISIEYFIPENFNERTNRQASQNQTTENISIIFL